MSIILILMQNSNKAISILLVKMLGTYKLTRAKNDVGYFTFLHNDMFIGEAVRKGKVWEPHIVFVLNQLLNPDKVSVNIGTHIGSHSVTMAKKSKKLYGFEPQPIIHWLMRLNLFDNGLTNFETFNKAVGNKNGKITLDKKDYWSQGRELRYDREEGVNYGAVSIGKGGTPIDMVTLDEMNIKDPISVILIDVEGAESAVFWGARETIKTHRPSLLFERNNRTITPEMEELCAITSEIKKFKIEEFVSNLNYNPPIYFGEEIFLIPMPENTLDLAQEYTNGWKCVDFNFVYPFRHPAKFAWIKNDELLVFFADIFQFFHCKIYENGNLLWSNGDLWIKK